MGALRVAAATDVGKVRDRNEDRWRADADPGLFIVSDGMGGAAHGELAAQIVVDLLPTYVEKQRSAQGRPTNPEEVLKAAIASLSDEVYTRSRKAGVGGTSATVVAAFVIGNHCAIGYLGDSRAYLLRDGHLTCVTTDHAVAQALLDAGEIGAEEFAHHPARNTLTRFVGMKPPARPDVVRLDLQTFDRILLCSDGVSGALDVDTLRAIVCRDDAPQALCETLIRAANDAGGHDNSTALLIDVFDGFSSSNEFGRQRV
jgi:serine/threonine protein phosphatase PrpC